jgi:cold shock CspA family protein
MDAGERDSMGTPPIIVDHGLHGAVASFDASGGWGMITSDSGDEIAFHCTAIADGSRDIAVGAAVRFDLGAGRMGRWEATAIEAA